MKNSVIVLFLIPVTYNSVTFLGVVNANGHNGEKCTARDSRPTVYSSCVLDYRVMVLWCDQTNLTTIPEPDTIPSLAPCRIAEVLQMNDSCIEELDPNVLKKYTSLRIVNLSKNRIRKIPPGLFDRTNQLRELDVSTNQINEIDERSFKGVTKLEHLNLMHNQLPNLRPRVFTSLKHLRRLHLDWNNLTQLNLNWFPRSNKIHTLSLQHNNLRSWVSSRAGHFRNLRSLCLDENFVEELGPENYYNMSSLRKLSLRSNNLSIIAWNTFQGAPSISYIDLRNNKLTELTRQLFLHLRDLRVLLLANNNLVTPHPDWFASVIRNNLPPSYTTSSPLTANRWCCDCQARPHLAFIKCLEEEQSPRSIRLRNYFDVQCEIPERGVMLSRMNETELMRRGDCETEDVRYIHCDTWKAWIMGKHEEEIESTTIIYKVKTGEEEKSLLPVYCVIIICVLTFCFTIILICYVNIRWSTSNYHHHTVEVTESNMRKGEKKHQTPIIICIEKERKREQFTETKYTASSDVTKMKELVQEDECKQLPEVERKQGPEEPPPCYSSVCSVDPGGSIVDVDSAVQLQQT